MKKPFLLHDYTASSGARTRRESNKIGREKIADHVTLVLTTPHYLCFSINSNKVRYTFSCKDNKWTGSFSFLAIKKYEHSSVLFYEANKEHFTNFIYTYFDSCEMLRMLKVVRKIDHDKRAQHIQSIKENERNNNDQ